MLREQSYMDTTPIRIAQISDIHLFANPQSELLGVKTEESIRAVAVLLQKADPQPDLIILSGDLAQDFSETAYLRIIEIFKEWNIPIYYLPGNHDDPKVMTKTYQGTPFQAGPVIALNHWEIILLNSHKPGAVEGYLAETELALLKNFLQLNQDKHAAIVFHHQPYPVGCAWLDNLCLKNANAFWEIVSEFHRVKLVLFGHIHQVSEKKYNGIPCYSAPSTCIQFKTQSDRFALEKLPPGYRWIELHANGSIHTEVRRTKNYVGRFEAKAKGY